MFVSCDTFYFGLILFFLSVGCHLVIQQFFVTSLFLFQVWYCVLRPGILNLSYSLLPSTAGLVDDGQQGPLRRLILLDLPLW